MMKNKNRHSYCSIIQQIANGRENRSIIQKRIINTYRKSLISFSLNIPGPEKIKPLYKKIFNEGYFFILNKLNLSGWDILYTQKDSNIAGDYALFCIDYNSIDLKKECILLEDVHSLGRLFDIDVFTSSGRIISRNELGISSRKCIVCYNDPLVCRRGKIHSLNEVLAIIENNANYFFYDESC